MSKTLRSLACASLGLGLIAGVAHASTNLLVNGGFDAGTNGGFQANNGTTVNATYLPGWTVQSTATTSVALYSTGDAANPLIFGFHVGDTTAGVASIYQDFSTVSGQVYEVSFFAQNGGGWLGGMTGVTTSVFDVVSGTTSGSALGSDTQSFNGPPNASATGGFTFVAAGGTSRIVIRDISVQTFSADALVDSVSVSAIPEPSSFAALAGVVMLGFAGMRRRRAS